MSANLAALLPWHKAVITDALRALDGQSLLARLESEVSRGGLDRAVAGRSLQSLEGFISSVLSFRAVHRRLARANMPLRPSGQGSGGYDLKLLDFLLARTRAARVRVRRLRARLGITGQLDLTRGVDRVGDRSFTGWRCRRPGEPTGSS